MRRSKVAIVGAGSVGTSMAYAVLIRKIARVVALYDINQQKVEAEVLDLAHGTQFTGASAIIGGTDPAVVEGAQVVVITAGAKQDPGQSRLELAATNVSILEKMIPELLKYAPDAVYVLVTNPCDVLTVAAQQISGLPASRVFASGTVLDTSRLRRLIADRAHVSLSSIHADIVGEHGDTSFAVWSQARIGPVPVLDWISDDGSHFTHAELQTLTDSVRNAAYKIIEGKGATNYAIGLAGARVIEAIVSDQDAVLPVSSVHHGLLGVDGVALSIPSVVGASGVKKVLEIPLSPEERDHLAVSAEALRQAQESLGL